MPKDGVLPFFKQGLMNAFKKISLSKQACNTKLHMVAASDRDGVILSLFVGNCGDGPEGRALLRQRGPRSKTPFFTQRFIWT